MDYNVDNEHDYSYNYDDYSDSSNEIATEPKGNKNKIIKYIIIIGFSLLFIVGLIILLINIFNKNDEVISLIITETMDLYVGDKRKINVDIKGVDDKNPKIVFLSTDESIASVSEDGYVTGVSDGSTNIIVTYYDKEDNVYSKNCIVSIMKKANEPSTDPVDTPNEEPEEKPSDQPANNNGGAVNLKYSVPSSNNGWYKGNVSISLTYNKNALKKLRYAINCEKNCNYKDITGLNTIVITTEGTNKITIVATNINGQTETKSVTIKIDKTKPTAKLNKSSVVYNNTGKVEVCATCSDSLSGCKENKVCYTHTQNVNNSSLIVYDKAGNSIISDTYKIVIDKVKPTCSLTYSDKKIVATVNDTGGSGLSYYGFNNKYTGTNEKEKSNIGAGSYAYYVKDKAGNTNSCSLTCSFTSWTKSSYQHTSCSVYTKAEAERDGATWYRLCVNGVPQGYVRYFKCK